MDRRKVQSIKDLILQNLRSQGLETPLLQKRIVDSWPEVAGPLVARYTRQAYIRNQTLVVAMTNAALRADLSMRRTEFVRLLNQHVGSQVIADIRFV